MTPSPNRPADWPLRDFVFQVPRHHRPDRTAGPLSPPPRYPTPGSPFDVDLHTAVRPARPPRRFRRGWSAAGLAHKLRDILTIRTRLTKPQPPSAYVPNAAPPPPSPASTCSADLPHCAYHGVRTAACPLPTSEEEWTFCTGDEDVRARAAAAAGLDGADWIYLPLREDGPASPVALVPRRGGGRGRDPAGGCRGRLGRAWGAVRRAVPGWRWRPGGLAREVLYELRFRPMALSEGVWMLDEAWWEVLQHQPRTGPRF